MLLYISFDVVQEEALIVKTLTFTFFLTHVSFENVRPPQKSVHVFVAAWSPWLRWHSSSTLLVSLATSSVLKFQPSANPCICHLNYYPLTLQGIV